MTNKKMRTLIARILRKKGGVEWANSHKASKFIIDVDHLGLINFLEKKGHKVELIISQANCGCCDNFTDGIVIDNNVILFEEFRSN